MVSLNLWPVTKIIFSLLTKLKMMQEKQKICAQSCSFQNLLAHGNKWRKIRWGYGHFPSAFNWILAAEHWGRLNHLILSVSEEELVVLGCIQLSGIQWASPRFHSYSGISFTLSLLSKYPQRQLSMCVCETSKHAWNSKTVMFHSLCCQYE